jgi:hypothetical protein
MKDPKHRAPLPTSHPRRLYLLGTQQRIRALPRLKIGRHVLLLTREEVAQASAAIEHYVLDRGTSFGFIHFLLGCRKGADDVRA